MKRTITILLISLFFFLGFQCSSTEMTAAKLYIQQKNYYKAKESLETAIANNLQQGNEGHYKNDEAYYLLGVVEGELNNTDAMLECFDKSEKISYRFTDNIKDFKNYYWAIYFNKGVEHYNKEEYEQAKADFEIALKLKPSDNDTKLNYDYVIASLNGDNVSDNISTIDNTKIETKLSDKKDIDGFQDFKWGLTLNEVKKLLANKKYEIGDSKSDFKMLSLSEFVFQGKESLLKIEFYSDKIYKISVHFSVGDNTAGMNEYFSMADLMKEVYGDTRKIAIGPESDDYNHRVTQINIGSLSYQHIWNTISGSLTFQLSEGSYGSFICSLFYSSKDAKKIDNQKSKSEF